MTSEAELTLITFKVPALREIVDDGIVQIWDGGSMITYGIGGVIANYDNVCFHLSCAYYLYKNPNSMEFKKFVVSLFQHTTIEKDKMVEKKDIVDLIEEGLIPKIGIILVDGNKIKYEDTQCIDETGTHRGLGERDIGMCLFVAHDPKINHYYPCFIHKYTSLLKRIASARSLNSYDHNPKVADFYAHEDEDEDEDPGNLSLSDLISKMEEIPGEDLSEKPILSKPTPPVVRPIPSTAKTPVPLATPALLSKKVPEKAKTPTPINKKVPKKAKTPAPVSKKVPAPVPVSKPAPKPVSKPAPVPVSKPAPVKEIYSESYHVNRYNEAIAKQAQVQSKLFEASCDDIMARYI